MFLSDFLGTEPLSQLLLTEAGLVGNKGMPQEAAVLEVSQGKQEDRDAKAKWLPWRQVQSLMYFCAIALIPVQYQLHTWSCFPLCCKFLVLYFKYLNSPFYTISRWFLSWVTRNGGIPTSLIFLPWSKLVLQPEMSSSKILAVLLILQAVFFEIEVKGLPSQTVQG